MSIPKKHLVSHHASLFWRALLLQGCIVAFLWLLATVAHAQPIIPGQVGDVTAVFDCAAGDCSSITLSDGDLLDMTSVTVSTTTEGLIFPQNTDCSSATAEGQVCWDTDGDEFNVGTGAGVVTIGVSSSTGDIEAVFDCTTGDCANVTLSDGDLLSMAGVSVTTTTEGLIFPQHATDCSAATAEGQVCWEADANILWIGDGAAAVQAGSGDITDVFDCASGNCNDIALSDGDRLDMSAVNADVITEGLILPQNTSCSNAVAEGQVCWDTDDNRLFVGTLVAAFELGDILSVYDCTSGACTSLAPADGSFLNMAAINASSTTEGLRLPQNTDCSAAISDGLVCWDTDNDALYVGNGSAAIQAGNGDITDVFDCASGDCSSITLSDGDLLSMASVNPDTTTEGLILPQATSCASATAEGQMCWDTDGDALFIGDGTTAVSSAGDITGVFDCSTGNCDDISASDGDRLTFASVNPNTTTEGFFLPQATLCTSATAEGQMCWDTDDNRLHIGDAAGTFEVGDILSVYDCTSGACTSIAPADGSFLNMAAINGSSTTEGLRLPQANDCSASSAAGQLCYDLDDDRLVIGDGATTFSLAVESVLGCTSGDCDSLAPSDGAFVNLGAINSSSTTEGFVLPIDSTGCAAGTLDGQACWDSTQDLLYVGDGISSVPIHPNADIFSVWNCNSGDCNTVAMVEGEGLDASAVDPDSAGEGIIFPTQNDCTGATIEGQACWDQDNDTFNVGTGSGVITFSSGGTGDITDVFNCASGDCSSVTLADGDLLSMASVTVSTTTEGFILPQATDDCASATAEGQVCWDSSSDTLYVGDGASPVAISQGLITLDSAFDNGKTIDGANSQANAFVIGDGTDGLRFYVGASGPIIECFIGAGTCDQVTNVASGNDFIINLDGTPALTITSAGAVTLGEALEETKLVPVPAGMLVVDGTHCTHNTDQTLASEMFRSTVTCADNDAATMKFDFPAPEAWDEAELTIDAYFFQNDATPDGNINIDWSGYCAGHNDPFGTDTFTAEDANGAMDFAASAVAQNDLIQASTVGQVPIGTCAEGDMIRIRGQVDATGTTAASPTDVHLLWLRIKIAYNDWSN
jgi:hypothetical protein